MARKNDHAAVGIMCLERILRARQQMAALEAILQGFEEGDPTWPIAGSLGHINETLEELLNGFRPDDGPRK